MLFHAKACDVGWRTVSVCGRRGGSVVHARAGALRGGVNTDGLRPHRRFADDVRPLWPSRLSRLPATVLRAAATLPTSATSAEASRGHAEAATSADTTARGDARAAGSDRAIGRDPDTGATGHTTRRGAGRHGSNTGAVGNRRGLKKSGDRRQESESVEGVLTVS